ncbi:hypothetical protein LCGC14_0833600 [marine sediment metagenome]|uniref:Zinc-ribbon domain-containing protein n=1 Tax=marine sediment metagenome TaxID=412755 RepID=A0A0F9SMK4_9ZZZZ|nr:MAG: hypothetical protein Lokiarch_35320 [Candidatus Lokiarchaeum sp. GC14_75]HEC36954.1 hypothetical protein [bacterium]
MSNCPNCNNPIREDQVICLNYGSQIKPLKIQRRSYKKICTIFIIFWVVMIVAMIVLLSIPSFLGG